jgi:hypothetical protein
LLALAKLKIAEHPSNPESRLNSVRHTFL